MPISISLATPADLPAILAFLERNKLPPDGLERHVATTLVARADGRLVGCAAIEPYGAAALLRSVAVEQSLRGQGLGRRLTAAALELARAQGARTVYLLTETAAEFFPRFGFAPIAREAVEPDVKQSVEFTTACPASAVVMAAKLVD